MKKETEKNYVDLELEITAEQYEQLQKEKKLFGDRTLSQTAKRRLCRNMAHTELLRLVSMLTERVDSFEEKVTQGEVSAEEFLCYTDNVLKLLKNIDKELDKFSKYTQPSKSKKS